MQDIIKYPFGLCPTVSFHINIDMKDDKKGDKKETVAQHLGITSNLFTPYID